VVGCGRDVVASGHGELADGASGGGGGEVHVLRVVRVVLSAAVHGADGGSFQGEPGLLQGVRDLRGGMQSGCDHDGGGGIVWCRRWRRGK